MTIDRVEQLTGIDFCYAIEDSIEEIFESTLDRAVWFVGGDYKVDKQDVKKGVEKQSTPAK